MRRAVFALALVLGPPFAREAHACLEAYHARRLVLGSSARGLVVLDLDLQRVGEDPRWKGPARVGVLSGAGGDLQEVRSLAAIDVGLGGLEGAVRERLSSGLAAAKAIAGFRPAGLPRYQACDFQRTCDRFSLVTEGDRVFVAVAGASPLRIPLTIPARAVGEAALPVNPKQFAAGLQLVSVLSYDIGGHEVLVVDLGYGDDERTEPPEGIWPPCGCADVNHCPPPAETMHHGSQIELVVPLSTPRPPPAPATRAKIDVTRPRLRTDGVYATEATCRQPAGWKRRFVRFRPDGIVRTVEANLTPRGAFLLLGNEHFVVDAGKYTLKGDRVSAALGDGNDDEDDLVDVITKKRLEGTLSRDALTVPAGATKEVYRFIEVK